MCESISIHSPEVSWAVVGVGIVCAGGGEGYLCLVLVRLAFTKGKTKVMFICYIASYEQFTRLST